MWILTVEWSPDVRGSWRLDTADDVAIHIAAVCSCKHCMPRVHLKWMP